MRSGRYLAAAATACLLWSGSLIGAKASMGVMGPMFQGFARIAIAALVFFAIKHARHDTTRPRGRDLLICASTGIVGITFYFASENIGSLLLPASSGSLIVGSFPAITLAFECALMRRLPTRTKAVGILLAFVGAGIIALTDSSTGGSNLLVGTLCLIGAGVCWAIYNLQMKLLVGSYSTICITAWQTLFGAIGFLPLALIGGLPTQMPSPVQLASLLYLALGCTVVGNMLYIYGLKDLSASTASVLVNLIPVFGLVLSWILMGDPVLVSQIVGCGAIIGGIALSTRQ